MVADLETMTFSRQLAGQGRRLLGDKKIRANAIALHTRALAKTSCP